MSFLLFCIKKYINKAEK